MDGLSERDKRMLERERLKETDNLARQDEELRQMRAQAAESIRETDCLINIAQTLRTDSERVRSDAGYLAEAQVGADNSGAQLQRGDQADRGSMNTQDERLSELNSNYSLVMEKEEFKATYILAQDSMMAPT